MHLVGLQQRYLKAVLDVRPRGGDAGELTPAVLSAAAVRVLPVTAAGISLSQKLLRVPLGWSDASAAVAERQQTTIGDGPCLSAIAQGQSLIADAPSIEERWPPYWAELERRTPFRSVASLPLRVADQLTGAALDLYAERPDLSSVLALDEAEEVASALAGLLLGMLEEAYYGDHALEASWIDDQPAVDRLAVWTAVGLMVSAADLDDADALARLRAFAYSNDLSLDDAAAQVVDRQIPLRAVLG
jgi:hypothetical protein